MIESFLVSKEELRASIKVVEISSFQKTLYDSAGKPSVHGVFCDSTDLSACRHTFDERNPSQASFS